MHLPCRRKGTICWGFPALVPYFIIQQIHFKRLKRRAARIKNAVFNFSAASRSGVVSFWVQFGTIPSVAVNLPAKPVERLGKQDIPVGNGDHWRTACVGALPWRDGATDRVQVAGFRGSA